MEEYEYEIENVKGKENKVADCLSRLFPITADTLKQAIDPAGITEDEGNETDNLKNQFLCL